MPPFGKITEFQANWLFRILDRRYRDSASTMVTLNVSDRKEAIERLGPQIVDRLIDGALAVHCNWQSRRAPQAGKVSDAA